MVGAEASGEHERQQSFGQVPDAGGRAHPVLQPAGGLTGREPPGGVREVVATAAVHMANTNDERVREAANARCRSPASFERPYTDNGAGASVSS